MFNSRIVVVPLDSEAVSRLEWNSKEQELYVQYQSGPNSYTETEVGYAEFTHLCQLAHERGSWGQALHVWKTDRKLMFEQRDYEAWQEFVGAVHPATLARVAAWAKEEVNRQNLDQLRLRITKQRGW